MLPGCCWMADNKHPHALLSHLRWLNCAKFPRRWHFTHDWSTMCSCNLLSCCWLQSLQPLLLHRPSLLKQHASAATIGCLLAVVAAVYIWHQLSSQSQQQAWQEPLAAFLGYSSTNSSSSGNSSSWQVGQVHSTVGPDGTTYGPSLGIFPHGCKWRDVTAPNTTQVTYQYWDAATESWTQEQPQACRVKGFAAPGVSEGRGGHMHVVLMMMVMGGGEEGGIVIGHRH
jgi:hypothetical protein